MANKRGNPLWISGGASPNPLGGKLRYKYSARTVEGALERFALKNYTARKLQALHDSLINADQKLKMWNIAMSWLKPKTIDTMTDAEVDRLYEYMEKQIEKLVRDGKTA